MQACHTQKTKAAMNRVSSEGAGSALNGAKLRLFWDVSGAGFFGGSGGGFEENFLSDEAHFSIKRQVFYHSFNLEEDDGLASTLSATTFNAVQASDSGAIQRALLRNGKVVNRDIYNGNSEGYTPVRASLIEVEFLSHPTALETVNLSNPSGVAIKQKFADDVSLGIFNNIRNQP